MYGMNIYLYFYVCIYFEDNVFNYICMYIVCVCIYTYIYFSLHEGLDELRHIDSVVSSVRMDTQPQEEEE